MCQNAVSLISKALPEVDNAESLLKIKNLIALFMQTMNVGFFSCFSPRIPSEVFQGLLMSSVASNITNAVFSHGSFPSGFLMISC